jgi:hypothetical protein
MRIAKIVECRRGLSGCWEWKTEAGMWLSMPYPIQVPGLVVYDVEDAPALATEKQKGVPF